MPRVGEEHRAQRRRAILDAAVACFDRRGLHGTTMQDIIAESGLSVGAIYTYYASKDAIIAAIASERHARERELLDAAIAADDPRAAMHAFVDTFFGWLLDPAEQRRPNRPAAPGGTIVSSDTTAYQSDRASSASRQPTAASPTPADPKRLPDAQPRCPP